MWKRPLHHPLRGRPPSPAGAREDFGEVLPARADRIEPPLHPLDVNPPARKRHPNAGWGLSRFLAHDLPKDPSPCWDDGKSNAA
jgi:hypothetical protein